MAWSKILVMLNKNLYHSGGRWIRTLGPPRRLPAPGDERSVSHATRRWRELDSNTRSPVRVCRRIETTDHRFQARGGGNVGGESRCALRYLKPFSESSRPGRCSTTS